MLTLIGSFFKLYPNICKFNWVIYIYGDVYHPVAIFATRIE